MSMKKILFTGFVPFLDNLVNPSKEILELIDDQDTYLLDVDYEKADEFFTGYGFSFLFVAIGIIRIFERDFIFRNAFDTAVADCRTISIAGKVFHGITISVKSFFYKGTPFF